MPERLEAAEVDAGRATGDLYDANAQRGAGDDKRGRRVRHRLGAMLAEGGITPARLDVDGKLT